MSRRPQRKGESPDQDSLAVAGSPARQAREEGQTHLHHQPRRNGREVDFIHEAAPEREDLKIKLFRDIDAAARPDVIIASSSSGFLPTNLQSQCKHPERVIIGHPFNPVYLLPLVETVPGEKTSADAMDRAGEYFEAIGMQVLRLKKEIMGYVCDRLQEALWREALHILNKDIGTTGDIDDSIVYSAGMRWAFMGSFLTYHVAGGPGGMRDFIKQFDPTLELDWTDLKFPKWNAALEQRLVEGCEAQAAGRAVRDRSQAQRHPRRHDEALQEAQDRRRPCAGARTEGKEEDGTEEIGSDTENHHVPARHDHGCRQRHRPVIAKAFHENGARSHL
jgi:3-hydroxyacyl-CoA dehydrogenase